MVGGRIGEADLCLQFFRPFEPVWFHRFDLAKLGHPRLKLFNQIFFNMLNKIVLYFFQIRIYQSCLLIFSGIKIPEIPFAEFRI